MPSSKYVSPPSKLSFRYVIDDNTVSFSGDLKVYYDDSVEELNGIDEANLNIAVLGSDSNWVEATSVVLDETENTIIASLDTQEVGSIALVESGSVLSVITNNNNKIRVFNKIFFNQKNNIKNLNYTEVNFDNEEELFEFIDNLKLVYEDFWKSQNQINTSVKLSLNISIDNSNNIKINKFEKILSDMDLIYNFSIYKFDNRNNFYKVIFNGTPDKFLEVMSNQNYDFEIKNKIWILNDKS